MFYPFTTIGQSLIKELDIDELAGTFANFR